MESRNKATVFGQCRCCLKDGYHKDIMKGQYKNGSREVFHDIFLDCFNLFLSTSPKLSTLICKSCISRLEDANEFKKLVTDTERQLLNKVDDHKDTLFVNVLDAELDIKSELSSVDVKLEPLDDELEDDHADDAMDVDIPTEPPPDNDRNNLDLDLIEGEADLLARFSRRSLRLPATTEALYDICPGFARHMELLRGKVVKGKSIEKILKDSELNSRTEPSRHGFVSEKSAQIANALTLLDHSNLTPFKSKNRTGFPCFYCRSTFDNVDKMKEHQQKSHKKSELRKLLSTYGVESLVIYVDITDLKCAICGESINSISELKSHLIKTHKKDYLQEFTDRVIPFKLSETNTFECQICGFRFETFGSIERHMNVHYRNYVCKDCGTGFVTKYRLKVHIKSMHIEGTFPCEVCKKVFTTQQKLKNHTDAVHKLVKRFKCSKCPERFSEYFTRQKHMVAVHGMAPLQYKCNVCDKSFDRRYTLSRHMKRDHLEERDYQCEMCSYTCFTNNELRVHMIKHNGARIFECAVCKKSYARKKTLKEHMRIHNNDRRFACAVCGQAFVQKCSLKGHIKTHHVEFSMQ
ncbi:zinc finger protein 718-like [Pectinophora gossypiella]|uniref:zinc finger protein 718-like n=1 Tax=Pectinophora gossypiella TaxID=13191 RepID=UPI00214E85BA|nr:zinc finger protein 718-like [Pectinophora gossypiella]